MHRPISGQRTWTPRILQPRLDKGYARFTSDRNLSLLLTDDAPEAFESGSGKSTYDLVTRVG